MAPQKNIQQDLQAPLITFEEDENSSLSNESFSERSSLVSDQPDVIIVQTEEQPPVSSNDDGGQADSSLWKKSSKTNSLKASNKKGAEVPVNCPHLETALFFFGIAGMIVSVLMLLQHIISNLISYS